VNGAHDIASEVFFKEDFPGWLYAVKKGATTVWERWNSILEDGTFDTSGMNSLNHYAYGSIKHWLVSEVTGITPMEPAYRKSRIAPRLTKGMTYAEASLETPYGLLSCSWTCDQGEICVKVTVPANTTAVLTLPEREGEILLASGTYTYTYATKTDLHVARFSMDSTLGEVLAEPAAKQLFDQLVPGMLDNPMISFAYGMTLNELVVQEPQAKPIYEAVLKQLNQNS
jgi:alpha-L-rhamnosidase